LTTFGPLCCGFQGHIQGAGFEEDVLDDEEAEMTSADVSTFLKWRKPRVRVLARTLEDFEENMVSVRKLKDLTLQCDSKFPSEAYGVGCPKG
jgi:hypothetical protein